MGDDGLLLELIQMLIERKMLPLGQGQFGGANQFLPTNQSFGNTFANPQVPRPIQNAQNPFLGYGVNYQQTPMKGLM